MFYRTSDCSSINNDTNDRGEIIGPVDAGTFAFSPFYCRVLLRPNHLRSCCLTWQIHRAPKSDRPLLQDTHKPHAFESTFGFKNTTVLHPPSSIGICCFQSPYLLLCRHQIMKLITRPSDPLALYISPKQNLVVEETGVLLNKGDVELLGSAEDSAVVLTAGRSGNVLDTRASSAEDVIDEGEL